eukprot:12325539-Karenia_brevis.AAC.1
MFRLDLETERSCGGKVRAQTLSLEWASVWGAKVTILHVLRLDLDMEKSCSGKVRAQKLSLEWAS